MSGTSWRSAPLPPDWSRRRTRVLERDSYTCQLRDDGCELIATDVDHRIPEHLGGTHDLSNLQAACGWCHRRKTGREARAAQPQRKREPERHPGEL